MRKNMLKKVLLIGLLLGVTGCFSSRNIMKNIELNSDVCKIDNKKSRHDGFLGDGYYFAKLICQEIKENELSQNWKKLPLSDSLNKIMNMKWCDGNGCKDFYEKNNVPIIQNGYYYFLDRNSEAKDKFDDNDLNSRNSFNFTVAILDTDTNILYYYELDT